MHNKKNLAVNWDQLPLLLSAKDIYERVLCINKNAVYEILSREDLPSVKIGTRIFVNKDHLRCWLEEKAVNNEKVMTGEIYRR